jgi:polyhydroxybutyrate depolymerase
VRPALVALSAVAAAGVSAAATAPTTAPCGRVASGNTTITIREGSSQRAAIVHVPTGYSGRKPVALVLDLHGSGSTADQQRLFSGMDKTANALGFVVAYPQGAIQDRSGFDWNVPGQLLVGGGKCRPALPATSRSSTT